MKFGLFSNNRRPLKTLGEAWEEDIFEIVTADGLGFDEAWISEHQTPAELIIAKAAALTKTIRLGSGVRPLGYYHPIQIALEGFGSFAMLHIGGWCFAEPVEQSLEDLVDPVHALGSMVAVLSASLAIIRPRPAVTAAMVEAMSMLVLASPSKAARKAPPTATRMAPTPARVVFVFFI